jgi:predicted metalloprotease
MKWKRNTGFDRIEDRRGQGGAGGLGGMFGGAGGAGGIPIPIPGGKAGGGIGGLVIIVIIGFLLFSGVLGGGGLSGLSGLSGGVAQPGGTLNPQNDTDEFLAWVTQDIQDFWIETFQASGRELPMQDLVLFSGS